MSTSSHSIPLDEPHHHTGNDGLSSVVASVAIRRVSVKDGEVEWFTASMLQIPSTDGPIHGLFMCSTMATRCDVSEITKGRIFIVSSSLYRPVVNKTFDLGQPYHAFYGEAHWLLRVRVPDPMDMRAPYVVVSGLCAYANNEHRTFSINISPKMCIPAGDTKLLPATREPSTLTTFDCYYPAEDMRRLFTPPYRNVNTGDCITVHGFLRYASKGSTGPDRDPFVIDIYSLSIATIRIPKGLILIKQ